MARRYFGTDGVRGVVGRDLTAGLVERLGRAAAYWCGGGRIFIGRDTRASGVELERVLAEGIASAGGNAVVAGVLPTPAVALLTLDLGCVITATVGLRGIRGCSNQVAEDAFQRLIGRLQLTQPDALRAGEDRDLPGERAVIGGADGKPLPG